MIEVVVHPRHWLAPLLRAAGVTLGRHVFLAAASADDELLEHEIEHVRQYERHGVPGFLARYLAAYLRGRIAGLGHRDAYRAIPFEEQARVAAARRRGPPSLPSDPDESRGPSPGRGA